MGLTGTKTFDPSIPLLNIANQPLKIQAHTNIAIGTVMKYQASAQVHNTQQMYQPPQSTDKIIYWNNKKIYI